MSDKYRFDIILKDSYIHRESFFIPQFKDWKKQLRLKNELIELSPKICAEKYYGFLVNLLEENTDFSCIQDYTNLKGGDLCYNLQIIKDDYKNNCSHSICVNISRILPYYHVHVLKLKRKKNNFSKWDGLPERDINLENTEYQIITKKIKFFLKLTLELSEFPEPLINKVIPQMFTEDIRIDEFTYYNAFFLKTFYTR